MSVEESPRPVGPPEPDSSRALLARAQAGDDEALNLLCQRYLVKLQRWATHRIPHWARDAIDTNDLVQQTMLDVLRNLHSLQPRHDGEIPAYLRQALLNHIRDLVRRSHFRPRFDGTASDRADASPSPLEQVVGREASDRYERCLQRLRAEDREAIILRVELGASYAEMAEAMKKPSADAARMTVGRALLRLSREMSRDG